MIKKWFERDKCYNRVPQHHLKFLSQYTREEFYRDFSLIFPERLVLNVPLYLPEAVAMMWNIASQP